MDTKKRLILKSLTWQVSGLLTMTLIGFIFTQSVFAGGGIALTGALVGFLSYFMHELAWSKVNWGTKIDTANNITRVHSRN